MAGLLYLACGVVRLAYCLWADGMTLAQCLQEAKDEYWPFEPDDEANANAAIGLILGIILWPYMVWWTWNG